MACCNGDRPSHVVRMQQDLGREGGKGTIKSAHSNLQPAAASTTASTQVLPAPQSGLGATSSDLQAAALL